MKDSSTSFATISLTLATISVSIATLCLTLLALSNPQNNSSLLVIPYQIRLGLVITGTSLLVGAALMLDWVIDSFSRDDWNKLNEIAKEVGERPFNLGNNYFFARIKLFGGGYFLLSLTFGFLTFAMLWLFSSQITFSGYKSRLLYEIVGGLCGVAVFVKMMTKKLGGVIWSLILIGGLVLIDVGLNIWG